MMRTALLKHSSSILFSVKLLMPFKVHSLSLAKVLVNREQLNFEKSLGFLFHLPYDVYGWAYLKNKPKNKLTTDNGSRRSV